MSARAGHMDWPTDVASLIAEQKRLADASTKPWHPPDDGMLTGGCWVCFRRGRSGAGAAGDPVWAAAVVMSGTSVVDDHVTIGSTDGPYVPGLLAMRVGRIMEECIRGLRLQPDVLIVDATGRDHPHRAGLALHIGAALGLPSMGVTHRPLVSDGDWPPDVRGSARPLMNDDAVVGSWLRTRVGARPLAVHPGWRVGVDDAVAVVMQTTVRHRTPEPLRTARQLARIRRAVADS